MRASGRVGAGRLLRIRQFAPVAVRGLQRDVRWGARVATFNFLASWRRSAVDPDDCELAEGEAWSNAVAPVREEEARWREQQRAELAARGGQADYEGVLHVRPSARGVQLDGLGGQPEVGEWLVQSLALDDWSGDIRRVKLTAELL